MIRFRLGDYELDPASGELFAKATASFGERVVLREQPLQVLRMLIDRAGDLVTRDHIKARLWPNDTIVDFDHSINVAIGVLRRALGDSATSSRYIETVARRGYRLLVPVERLEPSPAPPAAARENSPAPVEAVSVRPPAESSLVGRKVMHYRVLELIGGGGMGMVYKAEDLKLGRRVALKFLPEELAAHSAALRLLEREARTASSLNHPNICTIYDIEELDGQPFIAMELLEGETLQERMARGDHRLPLSAALETAIGVCDGLKAAHERGIVHRDIKPANVFMTRAGAVKILDFGVAKLVAGDEAEGASREEGLSVADREAPPGTSTRGTLAAGTPSYMSPEQVRREPLDVRTDLFSLGLVLYEMAVGVRPFGGDTRAAIQDAIVNAQPVPARERNASVPRELDRVIAKAIEKDTSRRYQSAAEMRADLERVRQVTRPGRRRARAWLGAAAVTAVLAAGVFLYRDFRRRVTLSETDTLVLADLANGTSDPAFDDGLSAAARDGLEQTPYLNVLARDKVLGTLAQLKLPMTTKVTPEVARRVCLQTNSKLVVAPSLADAGNGFRIALDALDCRSGATIVEVREDAASRSGVVRALGVSEARLRRKLGEPSDSLTRFDKPLEVATSASPEALQLSIAAYKRFFAGDFEGAVSLCRRAIELDPLFAVVYVGMTASHQKLGQFTEATAAATKAFELRDRMTEPHRLLAEFFYYDHVTGELDKAQAVAERWVQTYPRNTSARLDLARSLTLLGRLDRAADERREAARLGPSTWSYAQTMFSSTLAERPGEAKAAFDEAAARGLVNDDVFFQRLVLAFLQKDEPAIREMRARAEEKQSPDILYGLGLIEASHGRFRADRAWTQRAIDAAVRAGQVPNYYGAWAALRESDVGNAARALETAARALPNARTRDNELFLALAYAQAGDVEKARKLSDEVAAERPLDTLVQKYCLPTIRAAIKLRQKDPAAAVEILEPARPYELANPDSFGSLRPAYVRGLAYLALGRGRAAATEFQKLIDHPGLVGIGAIAALPRLQMGRAMRLAGDDAAARRSYEEFLALWSDADPDVPVYQQAKAEYAALNKGAKSPS